MTYQAEIDAKSLLIVGLRRSGPFADYGRLVSTAAEELKRRAQEIPCPTTVEVALYEPKGGAEHLEGTFWVGFAVTEKPQVLPDGMELLTVAGRYATVRGDERDMGALYGFLDRWIPENGQTRSGPEALILEVYDRPGTTEVQVCLPLKDRPLIQEVHYIRVPVADLPVAAAWYTRILGLDLAWADEQMAMVKVGSGQMLILMQADQGTYSHFTVGGRPVETVTFTSPEIRRLHQHLADHGVTVDEIAESDGHVLFHFFDPDGNKFQVHW